MALINDAIFTVSPRGIVDTGQPFFPGQIGLDQFRSILAQHASANDPALRALQSLGTSPNLALGEGALPSASRGLPAVLRQATAIPATAREAASANGRLAIGPGRLAIGPGVFSGAASGAVSDAASGAASNAARAATRSFTPFNAGINPVSGGLQAVSLDASPIARFWSRAGGGLPGKILQRGETSILEGGTAKGLTRAATPGMALAKGGLVAGVAGIPVEIGANWALGKAGLDEDSNWRRFLSGAAGGGASGAIMGAGSGPGALLSAAIGAAIGGTLNVASHELFKDRTSMKEVNEATRDRLADTLAVGRQLGLDAASVDQITKAFNQQVALGDMLLRAEGKDPTPSQMKQIRAQALDGIQSNLGGIVEQVNAQRAAEAAQQQQMAVEQANARIIAGEQQRWLAPLLSEFNKSGNEAITATQNLARRVGGDYGNILAAQAARAQTARSQMGMILAAQMQASPWLQSQQRAQATQNQIAQQIMAQAIGNIMNPPQEQSGTVDQEDLNALLGV